MGLCPMPQSEPEVPTPPICLSLRDKQEIRGRAICALAKGTLFSSGLNRNNER